MTVTVKVVVYEDDQEVGATSIRYFEGQDYIVKIDTGDGVDAQVVCTAGGSGSSVSDLEAAAYEIKRLERRLYEARTPLQWREDWNCGG